jgi:RNA polymerase sigma-54 factor
MRLSQQMKLAPHMIQSMEILQMPLLALQERIDQELESNIALELVEAGPEAATVAEPEDADSVDRLEQRELIVGEHAPSGADDWERLSSLESTYGEAFENAYSSGTYSAQRLDGERDRKMDAMANVAAPTENLTEQLLHQWTFSEVEPPVLEAGRRILAYIDEDGMLGADLETILDQNRNIPGAALSIDLLREALREIHARLDPPGVGARDRRECLLIQIDRLERDAASQVGRADDPGEGWADARRLITDHYDDLLQNRLPRIAQKTGLPIDRIQRAVALMRRLSISPGRDLSAIDVRPINPDVVVEFDDEQDAYVAMLSDGHLPRLRISDRYEQMAKDRAVDKSTREFITNNVRNAAWLIDAINQRRSTLLRVVNVVLARQRDFFDHGPQHLKAMPMTEVADQLGIHVATVSRAVADKWLQTPRGMIPLRKFFSGGTETEGGRDMSWDAIKATLREIVDSEDRARPFSDDALALELKKRGIDIARRTVVKYRQQMDIPPARRRRVF